MSEPAHMAPPSDWKPPAEFDLVKELNAHAGRLATVLGLLVAAFSFSVANGPIHDAIQPLDFDKHGLLYGCVVSLGINLFGGAASVLWALDPAFPSTLNSPDAWTYTIRNKTLRCTRAKLAGLTALVALLASWGVAYSGFDLGYRGFSLILALESVFFLIFSIRESSRKRVFGKLALWIHASDTAKRPHRIRVGNGACRQ